MTSHSVDIGGLTFGLEQPPRVIAEISGNHNGELGRALGIMEAAKDAGADAIKLQTYTADTMTIDCDRSEFRIEGGLWAGYSLYRLYEWAHTPWDWHPALFEKGRELGLTVFSTPFDESAVELLESLGAPAYKIASFEVVDLPLIERVATTGKPIILSTGMASLEEISEAVETARTAGCKDLILLHCISAYPAPAEDANLRAIPALAQRFDVLAGLSDHTLGTVVAVAAIAQGAVAIEKHVTLSRADGGPDAAFSLEPDELARLCSEVRTAWQAQGDGAFTRPPSEKGSLIFRRSLFAIRDIAAGETLTAQNVRRIRPGHGLAPKHLDAVLGRRAKIAIARGTPLAMDLIE